MTASTTLSVATAPAKITVELRLRCVHGIPSSAAPLASASASSRSARSRVLSFLRARISVGTYLPFAFFFIRSDRLAAGDSGIVRFTPVFSMTLPMISVRGLRVIFKKLFGSFPALGRSSRPHRSTMRRFSRRCRSRCRDRQSRRRGKFRCRKEYRTRLL